MRILHTIAGRNWGGMERRALEQIEWLAGHGHAAWLAAPPDGETFRRAQALGLAAVPMVFDPPWRPATLAGLRRFVRDNRVDVIDAHVTRDAKAAMACLGLCAVVRTRHTDQFLRPSPFRRLQWRLGNDHIVTVADSTRRQLIDTGLAAPDRATWIGGWADERYFHPEPGARERLRRELGVADGTTVLLCAAMLRPDKGHDHLLHAVRLLLQQGRPLLCLLAGTATAEGAAYEATLRSLAQGLGIEDSVRFLGYRADVPDLMRAADIGVIASLIEGIPQVSIQAFASGLPLVATAVGGTSDIVIDGETGWLVPPRQPEALADAIAKVMAAPEAAAEVAAAARRLAETTMRLDLRMRLTLEVYAAALDHARRRMIPARPDSRAAG